MSLDGQPQAAATSGSTGSAGAAPLPPAISGDNNGTKRARAEETPIPGDPNQVQQNLSAHEIQMRTMLAEFQKTQADQCAALLAKSLEHSNASVEALRAQTNEQIGEIKEDIGALKSTQQEQGNLLGTQSDRIALLETTAADLLRRVSIAEQPRITRAQVDAESFDRTPDPQLVRLSTHPHVTSVAAVVDTVNPFLLELGFEENQFRIYEANGNSAGKQFYLSFAFSLPGNVRAASKVLANRKSGGEWRNLSVKTVSGTTQRVYVGPDENRQAEVARIMGKTMVNRLREAGHDSAHYRANAAGCGFVHFGKDPVAKLEPRSNQPSGDAIKWNPSMVGELKIAKDELIRIALEGATAPIHRVEWSL